MSARNYSETLSPFRWIEIQQPDGENVFINEYENAVLSTLEKHQSQLLPISRIASEAGLSYSATRYAFGRLQQKLDSSETIVFLHKPGPKGGIGVIPSPAAPRENVTEEPKLTTEPILKNFLGNRSRDI